jgi:hypothetical protein
MEEQAQLSMLLKKLGLALQERTCCERKDREHRRRVKETAIKTDEGNNG